ncbi:hypothetical protein SLE2022_280880 [Rubroshorea leprosula]
MAALRLVLPTRTMTPNVIARGIISASNQNFVHDMPTIQPGCISAPLRARDLLGNIYHFRYKRRMVGPYNKQTISGMRPFFQAHGLQSGDQVTIYKERDEVRLLGQVIQPALYLIHFQRA